MPRRIPFLGQGSRPGPVPRAEDKAERDRFYSCRSGWRKLRAAFLAANPLCEECTKAGKDTIATTVHHRVERLADPDQALSWENLEASCSPCHTRRHKRKTH